MHKHIQHAHLGRMYATQSHGKAIFLGLTGHLTHIDHIITCPYMVVNQHWVQVNIPLSGDRTSCFNLIFECVCVSIRFPADTKLILQRRVSRICAMEIRHVTSENMYK